MNLRDLRFLRSRDLLKKDEQRKEAISLLETNEDRLPAGLAFDPRTSDQLGQLRSDVWGSFWKYEHEYFRWVSKGREEKRVLQLCDTIQFYQSQKCATAHESNAILMPTKPRWCGRKSKQSRPAFQEE